MSNREFTATRTMLANAFATAGAELLAYMGSSSALAAIPDTDPPKYVAAGPLDEIAKLLPAFDKPAAATVLTDERIDEIARKEGDEDKYGFIFNKDGRFSVNSFARAIEAEVLAHAGVTAEPVGWVTFGTKDGKQKLDQACLASNPYYIVAHSQWIWQPVYLAAPTIPAQVPAAEVRVAALEEAALVCEEYAMQWHQEPSSRASGKKAGGFDCAAAIRALKGQSTADKASEMRAAWISVETQLPTAENEDTGRDVMVSDSLFIRGVAIDGGAAIGLGDYSPEAGWRCYGGDYDFMHFAKVTHWMKPSRPAAPSTADSANTGALGEGADVE